MGGPSFEWQATHVDPTLDESIEQTEFARWGTVDKIRTSYDVVAEKYATELADPMVERPLERGLFLAFTELIQGTGPAFAQGSTSTNHPVLANGVIGDVGCGPGHVTRALSALGLSMVGYDISTAMLEYARKKFPTGDFKLGSMLELPVEKAAWSGAVTLYATLHSPPEDRARTFRELHRVIKPGGFLLHSFFVSAEGHPAGTTYRIDKWFGYAVDLDVYFIDVDPGCAELEQAGFDVQVVLIREPMTMTELPARRCYIIGKRR